MGREGTDVTIKVHQPKTDEFTNVHDHARSARAFDVQGVRKRADGEWDCRLDATAPIAYLRISEITASTVHDLRKLAAQVERQGNQAIVLDLRSVGGTAVHPAVMLADTLLAGGMIGRMQTAEREVTFQADSDAMFRLLPIAVLVDQFTFGTAEWIVAALQDNHRATIVGRPTFGALVATQGGLDQRSDIRSRVPLGDWLWSNRFDDRTSGTRRWPPTEQRQEYRPADRSRFIAEGGHHRSDARSHRRQCPRRGPWRPRRPAQDAARIRSWILPMTTSLMMRCDCYGNHFRASYDVRFSTEGKLMSTRPSLRLLVPLCLTASLFLLVPDIAIAWETVVDTNPLAARLRQPVALAFAEGGKSLLVCQSPQQQCLGHRYDGTKGRGRVRCWPRTCGFGQPHGRRTPSGTRPKCERTSVAR